MGLLALRGAAHAKQEIAAKMVQARQFQRHAGVLGQRLGLFQESQALSGVVLHAHACGNFNQRESALHAFV